MGFNKLIISFAMILMFSIALISYVGNYATDNDASININNDSGISSIKTTSRSQLSVLDTDANDSSVAFGKSTIASGGETLETGSVFKTPFNFFTGIKNILSVGNKEIFGNDSDNSFGIIFTTIGALLLILIVTATWKLWKGGLPE